MHQHASLLMHPRTAPTAALAVAGLAVIIGIAIPSWIPLHFVEEGGAIETVTLYAYLVAVVGINLLHRPGISRLDLVAASIVLVAMGAREADLHTSMYGISILKSRFYLDAPPHRILGALTVLAPIALAICWLLSRYGRYWLLAPGRWSAAATTMAWMIGIMVIAKMFDRAPVVLGLTGQAPSEVLHVLLSLEELLELSLPGFALLAMAQCRIAMTVSLSELPTASKLGCRRRR